MGTHFRSPRALVGNVVGGRCRLLAQRRHPKGADECPGLGDKQTMCTFNSIAPRSTDAGLNCREHDFRTRRSRRARTTATPPSRGRRRVSNWVRCIRHDPAYKSNVPEILGPISPSNGTRFPIRIFAQMAPDILRQNSSANFFDARWLMDDTAEKCLPTCFSW
jgi:hypothetical protein